MDPGKHIHSSASQLPAFIGAMARLWKFSPTHDVLAIQLATPRRTGYLVLSGCSDIRLPVCWTSVQPELQFDAKNVAAPVMFSDGGTVRVACEGALIHDSDPMR